METSDRQRSLRAGLIVGVTYFLIGRLFALPADHVQMWRMAAWVCSAAVYTTHIGFETFTVHSSRRWTALHVALAAACGALLLAVAGMLHALGSASGLRATWLLALVIWPAVTAVPAFLVALVVGMVLQRLRDSD
jgi:hypothetical protein